MKVGDRDTPGTRIYAERDFRENAQVLVATEAAGEGINLQFCWFMINYDIPWNPVRLEQRMGRIHRYGQEKDCLIFNFVSTNTREGRVLQKLFERIKIIEEDLDPRRTGKVFNVLGDVFPANLLEKMIRDMYAHNQMTRRSSSSASSSRWTRTRFERITNSHPGGPGQARTEPVRHHRQVRRGQGTPAWCPKSSRISSRKPRPSPASSPGKSAKIPTSTASVACRARSGPSANAWSPASASWVANTRTSSSTSSSCRKTPRSNGSRRATRCLRPCAKT